MPRASRTPVIVVDGLSGAGKTTFAHALADALGDLPRWDGARILSLDTLYEGWHGLAAGSRCAEEIVEALASGEPARYRPWDWQTGARGDEEVLRPGAPVILEGCGALTSETRRRAVLVIWIEASGGAQERYRRAITRDGDLYEPWWEVWAEQDEARLVDLGGRESDGDGAAVPGGGGALGEADLRGWADFVVVT
ncbi:AAA family ATPase [Actinomyces sp. B33]|uniref:AAA family ATPase n=1 Tax=Actinomyces sp. B33 TaxID=2942131 RepID=UPI00233F9E36|nr:AAA family ATPase [Actinomyces sp. B33]MDC4233899.1 AAA family ATPase [Actinomyces sp. B33]